MLRCVVLCDLQYPKKDVRLFFMEALSLFCFWVCFCFLFLLLVVAALSCRKIAARLDSLVFVGFEGKE